MFAILDDLNCQTFMTGTEASLFSSLQGRAQFLTVSHGTVSRTALTMAAEPTMFRAMTKHETPPLSPEELERYARHIVLPEIGGAGQQRLKRARVLVIGAGGLGAPVLEYLAAAGVGTLGLVDDDVVSLSNLQRQVIHDTQAVGLAKTESAASVDRPHQSARVGRDPRAAADGRQRRRAHRAATTSSPTVPTISTRAMRWPTPAPPSKNRW